MSNDLAVVHNEADRCFEIFVDGYRAHLDYRQLDENTLDYCHTFVPDELRGRGVAGKLTAAALDYAKEQGLQVVPSCSYVEVFIKRQQSSSG